MCAATSMLHQPSTQRSEWKISSNKKVGLHHNYSRLQAQTIFPSTHNSHLGRQIATEDNESSRSSQTLDIQYQTRIAIIGQALANFIAKITTKIDRDSRALPWKVHMDRSSNRQAGGIGVVMESLKGDLIECAIRLQFPKTNNEAEYETLLAGFNLAKTVSASSIVIYCNSQVVVGQVNKDY